MRTGQRQQGEHRAVLKPLIGDIAVRLFAAEVRHHRALPIVDFVRRDEHLRTHERLRAVGADNELPRHFPAIVEPQQHAVGGHVQSLASGGREQLRLEVMPKGILQHRILDDPRERRYAGGVGVELEPRARLVAVDAHRVHRHQPVLRHGLPDPKRLQERDVARAERVDPRVERGARHGLPVCVSDQGDRQAARSPDQAGAHRPAADDDEIVHRWVYNRGFSRGELAQLVRAAES